MTYPAHGAERFKRPAPWRLGDVYHTTDTSVVIAGYHSNQDMVRWSDRDGEMLAIWKASPNEA